MADGKQVSLYLRWEAIEAITRHVERAGGSLSRCASDLIVMGDRLAGIEGDMARLRETHDKREAE